MKFTITDPVPELVSVDEAFQASFESIDFRPLDDPPLPATEAWIDDLVIGENYLLSNEDNRYKGSRERPPYLIMQDSTTDKSIVHIRIFDFVQDSPELLLLLGMASQHTEIVIFFDCCSFSDNFQKALMNAIKYSKASVVTVANAIFELSSLLVWLSGSRLKVGPFSRVQFGDRSIVTYGSRQDIAEGLEHNNKTAENFFKYVIDHGLLTAEEYSDIMVRKASVNLYGEELTERVAVANEIKSKL